MENDASNISPEQRDLRTWATALHLSLLAGYIIPLGGFVAPVVIWLTMERKVPGLDEHGRVVVNWMITHAIYWTIAILLCFVLIGIPLVILIACVSVAFPIVGAIKANNGEVWTYPFSIRFF